MSKSLGNYIGVNEDADTMYTKVMKIPDNMIIKYYELCTDVHPDEIAKIKQRFLNGENPRDIKMKLAKEITTLYHSKEEAEKAEENFKTAFQKQEAPENTKEIIIERNTDNLGNSLLDGIMTTGEYKSKGELRRLFEQGAVKINGEKITDIKTITKLESGTILQIGKGKFYKLV